MSTVTSEFPRTAEERAVEQSHGFILSPNVALTARESEILTLIARGYSNQEIASELYLSINSIKTYIRSAYRRIGVERRTQAVVWAITHAARPIVDEVN